jgi:hypothetical protein
MSTDLATLFSGNVVPIEGLDEDTLAVAGGGGGGRQNKRISIKGGVFRKYAGGKEIGAIEDRYMNVIFVKMAHTASRMYYDKPYKEGEKLSPACWSSDSNVPDADVKTPISATCATCPNSVKGSGDSGTGTKCRLSWRTAVVLPQDPGGDVMQLVLPPTSAFAKEDNGRWGFRPYIQHLASHNVSAGRVITKMQFDTKSPVPKVVFSPVGAVSDDDLHIIARQAKSAAADAAIKLNVYQTDNEGEEPAAPSVMREVVEEPVDEPVKRESKQKVAAEAVDVSDVVKKWSKS